MINLSSGAEPWKPPRIDIENLFALGKETATPEVPDTPALCLRLSRYVSDIYEDYDSAKVQDWAKNCFDHWSEQLNRRNPQIMKATLATDPGNLILGIKALNDKNLSNNYLEALLDFYVWVQVTGVSPLSRFNQTVLRSILSTKAPVEKYAFLNQPLSNAELISEMSPAALAALALVYVCKTDGETPVTIEEAAGVGLRSVWQRDVSGVGLSLFATKTMFGQTAPEGLINWLRRVARNDGFFGMWELYEEKQLKANLQATVNVYWGLSSPHARSKEPEPGFRPLLFNKNDLRQRSREAIKKAQTWLEKQEDRFVLLPACKDEDHYENRFKPLVEICLLCYLLTLERHRKAKTPWAEWAQATAARFFPHIEWEGMMEGFRYQTSATLGIAIYPFLTEASGKQCRFSAEAKQILEDPFAQAQERTPMREMDYQFTRYCMGAPLSSELIQELIDLTVLKIQTDPLLLDTDALYDITHIVFYATCFGCRPWSPGDKINDWLQQHLNTMMLARFLMNDADLGSEFLITRFFTGKGLDECSIHCIQRLLSFQLEDGSFLGPDQDSLKRDAFDKNYHTTLVALAALAEAELHWQL